MQAARLLPGPTQSAAEPTTGTTAAAASADTDENDRVCVGGVGACSVLRAATQGDVGAPAGCGLLRADCVQHVQHVQRGALIAALTALVRAIRPVASVLARCYGLLLKATSEHQRAAGCCYALIACTMCTTCSEELVTCMGC